MNGVSKDRDRGLNISTGEGNNKLQQKHLKSEFRAAGHYAVSIHRTRDRVIFYSYFEIFLNKLMLSRTNQGLL